MGTPKFTPSPWRASIDGKLWKINSIDGNICIIAHEDRKTCNKAANARLLAAAPEMYILLEMLLQGAARGEIEISNGFTNAVENILNKATGGV